MILLHRVYRKLVDICCLQILLLASNAVKKTKTWSNFKFNFKPLCRSLDWLKIFECNTILVTIFKKVLNIQFRVNFVCKNVSS